MSVIEGLREAYRLPDLRRRILITLALLVIYRFAANVPVPGVDREVLRQVLSPQSNIGAFAAVLDLLSGGAVSNFSVLAMGVYPYITASIILQILTPVIPALEELQKEGQSGRDKLNRLTYYAAIPLAIFQAIGQINIFGAGTATQIIPGFGFGAGSNIPLTLSVIATMTAGTMFAIWIGELITEDGIGNGLSLIIFAGIVARVPFSLPQLFSAQAGATIRNVLLFVIMTILTLVVIVVVQEGQRRIPVKYGKRVRGTKMYGGGSTYLPLRVNTAGMIPLIFAQSLLTFPAVIAAFFQNSQSIWLANTATSIANIFGSQGGATLGGQLVYWIIYFAMVVGFTYLYTGIMIKNQNLADNLQRNGGFIPGIRPGRRTEDFINRVVTRITLVGALFLGFVAVLPGVVQIIMNLIQPGSGLEVRNALYIISGGGLIIIVGVVLDTLRQLEAQLVMRHRETFIR
ncbi:MAG TPA: preprotein translocase subunit SecY [Aggregatilineales bacterium]|nr:preprotein translocase subunit SecY [Aggregatilineales bacterium]